MNKQIVVHPYNGIVLSNNKEQTIDICNNTDGSQMCYAKWKKPDRKGLPTV